MSLYTHAQCPNILFSRHAYCVHTQTHSALFDYVFYGGLVVVNIILINDVFVLNIVFTSIIIFIINVIVVIMITTIHVSMNTSNSAIFINHNPYHCFKTVTTS